jgi:hypothetical protein
LGEFGVAGGGGGIITNGQNAVRQAGSYLGMFRLGFSALVSSTTVGAVSNQPYSIPIPSGIGSSDYAIMTLFGNANGGGLTTPSGWTALSNFTNLGSPDIYGGVFIRAGAISGTVTVNDAINSRSVSYIVCNITFPGTPSNFTSSSNGQLAGDSDTATKKFLVQAREEDNLTDRSAPTGFSVQEERAATGTYDVTQVVYLDSGATTTTIYSGDFGQPGDGGSGNSSDITGTTIVCCGGGGGGDASQTGSNSIGKNGGGDGGGTSTAGQDGTANSGGGGGGSATNAIGQGNGGSGVVRLRYDSARSIASVTGTLVYSTSTDGTDTIASFTSGTGTVTFA